MTIILRGPHHSPKLLRRKVIDDAVGEAEQALRAVIARKNAGLIPYIPRLRRKSIRYDTQQVVRIEKRLLLNFTPTPSRKAAQEGGSTAPFPPNELVADVNSIASKSHSIAEVVFAPGLMELGTAKVIVGIRHPLFLSVSTVALMLPFFPCRIDTSR